MAIPIPGHFCRWHLEPQDDEEAHKFNDKTLKMLETMNVELAEAMAEFPIEVGTATGAVLNHPDFLLLRGRRSVVLQLLGRYDEVMGAGKPPEQQE